MLLFFFTLLVFLCYCVFFISFFCTLYFVLLYFLRLTKKKESSSLLHVLRALNILTFREVFLQICVAAISGIHKWENDAWAGLFKAGLS